MQELVSGIAEKLGIDSSIVEKAIGIILNFLQSSGPSDQVGELIGKLPGAGDLMAKVSGGGGDSESGGLAGALGGMLGGGGGLMAALGQLQSLGLDVEQSKAVAGETIAFAKEKAGDDLVSRITDSIPGLNQVL